MRLAVTEMRLQALACVVWKLRGLVIGLGTPEGLASRLVETGGCIGRWWWFPGGRTFHKFGIASSLLIAISDRRGLSMKAATAFLRRFGLRVVPQTRDGRPGLTISPAAHNPSHFLEHHNASESTFDSLD